tara:strand:+ start:3145 stop:3897 length:753 start_codon:yes stop_codon:yes gene_type:complete
MKYNGILKIIFLLLRIALIVFIPICLLILNDKKSKEGCIVKKAINYDSSAKLNDNSCKYSREKSCNGNGEPDKNGYCNCDENFGGLDCDTFIGLNELMIENKKIAINNQNYIVNTFSLNIDDEGYLLPFFLTVNDLDIDDIYINNRTYNMPPLPNESDDTVIYNTYFSIGDESPNITMSGIENILWPDLNNSLWGKYAYSITNEPIKILQITLKETTNKTNSMVLKYGSGRFVNHRIYNLDVKDGYIIKT